MPVTIGAGLPVSNPLLDVLPDVAEGSNVHWAVLHSMTAPAGVPPDFDELPEEDKERIRNVLRFQGIKLRHDIKDKSVPLSRETMDIP